LGANKNCCIEYVLQDEDDMNLKEFVYKIAYYIKYLFLEIFTNCYVVHGYFPLNNKGKVGLYNLGDDLNLYLIALIANARIIPYQYSILSHVLHKRRYSCIGSIIASSDKYTIIWGSGAIENRLNVNFDFLKICSVRGPLTRQLLLNSGYECPQSYGDPALLVSKYYKPFVEKKYKIGIIPHYIDLSTEYLSLYSDIPSVKIINLHNYKDWRIVINEILSCEFIISSSLHGIIISDSYNIPNVWCKFSMNIYGDDFKYKDYFYSVSRNPIVFIFDKYYDLDYLLSLKTNYSIPNIQFDEIIKSCPLI